MYFFECGSLYVEFGLVGSYRWLRGVHLSAAVSAALSVTGCLVIYPVRVDGLISAGCPVRGEAAKVVDRPFASRHVRFEECKPGGCVPASSFLFLRGRD